MKMIEDAFLGYAIDGGRLLVRCCAWCSDRASLETWAKRRQLPVTHGICPACAQAQSERMLGESAHSRLTGDAETPA